MRIELHIDRVVLDGVGDPRQVPAIQEALHAELSRLLTTTPPAARRPRRERRVGAPEVLLRPTTTPAGLGAAIAHSVHSGVLGAGERRATR